MVAEMSFFFTVAEVYLAVVLPTLLGTVRGSAVPFAGLATRFAVSLAAPLGYAWMYFVVCGCIHAAYTYIWPEEGRRLSIQGKPMTRDEFEKAIKFSCKCIFSVSSVSSYMYYALQGWTNVRWAWPELRELPWLLLAYFLIDIAAYGVHRFVHRPWWYVRVHKVHHLWKSPNCWVTSALHPVEFLALTSTTMIVIVSLPLSLLTGTLLLCFIYVCNAMDHSGMRLESLLLSRVCFWQAHPEFHDSHHEYFHANYGAMVDWWDRLGGTYYDPRVHGNIGMGEAQFTPASNLIQKVKGN
jgi:sterol desaturase/sphingolipid hydroxylase (fatty acid hydroxylase superfamily)